MTNFGDLGGQRWVPCIPKCDFDAENLSSCESELHGSLIQTPIIFTFAADVDGNTFLMGVDHVFIESSSYFSNDTVAI